MNSRKSSLLYKYVLFYIIVLLIPIVVVWFTSYNYFTQVLKEELTLEEVNRLTHVKDSVDERNSNLLRVMSNLSLNRVISAALQAPEDKFQILTAQLELKNYIANYDFINEVSIYIKNSHQVMTSVGEYSIDLYSDIYRYSNWDKVSFYQILNGTEPQYIHPADTLTFGTGESSNKRVITYVFSYPTNSTYPVAKVIFHVDEDKLVYLLKNTISRTGETALIIDQQGRIITSLQDAPYISSEPFIQISNSISNQASMGSQIIETSNSRQLVFYVRSNVTGWLYIRIVPYMQIMEKLGGIKYSILVALLITFCVGALIIYFLTKISYNPIKQIKELVRTLEPNALNGNRNEIESAKYLLLNLAERNSHLNDEIIHNRQAQRDIYLQGLLKGQFDRFDELNNKSADEIGIKLTGPYFSAAIFHFSKLVDDEHIPLHRLKGMLEQVIQHAEEGYCIESLDRHAVILVMSLSESTESNYRNKLSNFHSNSQILGPCTVGAGNVYSTIRDLGKSYIEALSSLDYSFIKGKNQVIMFSHTGLNEDNYPINMKALMENLRMALKLSDVSQIADCLDKLIDTLKTANMSLVAVKLLCFDIINVIVGEGNKKSVEPASKWNPHMDMISIANYETIDELSVALRSYCLNLFVDSRKESSCNDQLTSMLTYIGENCFTFEFSIQNMAQHFNMSPSRLSHYFKDQTGQNIIDYVTLQKMETVQSMLRDSDEHVKNIIEKVGFSDVSSFSRKFKSITGLTPGKYRQLHQRKAVE
ncbi:helix-turn-helix domain-containing protein [Paenibacillus phytorum]|nr:helix-turn-helix domain-containing protein [Paenibacillus phytorum]